MASTKRKVTPLGRELNKAGACGVRRRFAYSTTASAFKRATYYDLSWYVRNVLRQVRLIRFAERLRGGEVKLDAANSLFTTYDSNRIGAGKFLSDIVRAAHPELRDLTSLAENGL